MIRKILKDCFTGKDNESFSIARFQWFIATVFAMTMEVYSVGFRGAPFDVVAFCTGMGGLLAAGGLALSLGGAAEPPPPPPPVDPVQPNNDGTQ